MRLSSCWVAFALTSAASSAAFADDPVPAPAAPAAGAAATGAAPDVLTLPKGRLLVDAFLEANLSSGAVFKPFSIAPDLWYGVSDDLTVGLTHSGAGETGFISAALGDSLCLTGTSNGCGKVYNELGLDARYALTHGNLSWAADGGLAFHSLSPNLMSLKLGAVGRWASGKLAIELEPALYIGLTNRGDVTDPTTMVTTNANPDIIGVPVALLYAVNDKLQVGGQTGLVLPLEHAGDTYRVPLSLGLNYRVSTPLSLLAAFSFPALIAKGGGADLRSLVIGGGYAF